MAEIGLRDAIEAAYTELYSALHSVQGTRDLAFRYTGIEMEFTVEVGQQREGGGGVKVWVVEGAAKRVSDERKTHTIRLTIEPVGADGRAPTVNDGRIFPQRRDES
ncbi:trypco2 family protein [Streptomyces sp. NPDC058251]|uniref:trypco2 family protein n=1 Tax=Streptomyces sp. NPDC058251 TaxID=3346404 RepID=UPI0036E4EDCF